MTGREMDRQIDETVRAIAKLFREVEFTAEEQRFVEDAGRKLMESSFETLVQSPNAAELRPFVVMFSMAARGDSERPRRVPMAPISGHNISKPATNTEAVRLLAVTGLSSD